jgi:hypothetical protein
MRGDAIHIPSVWLECVPDVWSLRNAMVMGLLWSAWYLPVGVTWVLETAVSSGSVSKLAFTFGACLVCVIGM